MLLPELHRLYDRLTREGRARVLAGLAGTLDALAGLPWLDGAEGRGRAAQALLYLLDTARAGIQAAQLPDSGVREGVYAYPSLMRVDRKGRIESITSGSGGGPTLRTATVADNGGSATLPGTADVTGGFITGWCITRLNAGGAIQSVSIVSVAFANTGALDTTGDTTGCTISYSSGVVFSSAPLVLGFYRELYCWVVPAS
jgi:hypothetical protein